MKQRSALFVAAVAVAFLASGCVGSPATDTGTSPAPATQPNGPPGTGVEDPTATDRPYSTATERFDHSVLDESASEFVRETDFGNTSLVVVESYPASSVPDVRVESVTRVGGRLRVATDDSSRTGTDDITVETLLLRVRGDPPESVEVTPVDGEAFGTDDSVSFDRRFTGAT